MDESCTWSICLREEPRNKMSDSYILATEKILTGKRVGKTEPSLTTNPNPSTMPYNQDGTPTPSFSLRSKWFGPHISGAPTIRLPLKRQAYTLPGSESRWACVHKFHRAVANGEVVAHGRALPTAITPGLTAGKNSPTPVAFPGRGGTAYFTNCCCLKDWLLISMHLGANYILQGAQKIQGTLPPSSPSGSHSNNILKSPVLIFPVMRPTMF